MLETGKEERGALSAPVAAPGRTSFPDGRMTSKEAWNYCRALCAARKIQAPTLRTFRWHLKHGNTIDAELVRNPFGGAGADRVHAITAEAVQKFVAELETRGDELHKEQPPRAKKGAASEPPSSPQPQAPPRPAPQPVAQEVEELDAKEALEFVHQKVGRGCLLNQTTFGFYLAYDILSSQYKGRQRVVRRDDLDAFLELFPDGIYANHISYETELGEDDLSMRDAYSYYADVDPHPVTLNSFRSLVAAGIIRPIRTADSPKAPVLGFHRQEISAFLALRQRILEKNSETSATKAFLTRKTAEQEPGRKTIVSRVIEEALESAFQKVHGSSSALRRPSPPAPSPPPPAAPPEDPGRVPVQQAYDYYAEKCPEPHTISWFRTQIRKGTFEAIENPARKCRGAKYLVMLESVDAYLENVAKGPVEEETPDEKGVSAEPAPEPLPAHLAVEQAYHRLREVLPEDLSMLKFKDLVEDGTLETVQRGGVKKVVVKSVQEHFGASQTQAAAEEASGSDADVEAAASEDVADDETRVTVSISDYSNAQELKAAITLLSQQGLKVDVRP